MEGEIGIFQREYITLLLIIHLLTSKGMNFPSHPLLDCFVPPVSGNAAHYLRCTAHSVLVNCSCSYNDILTLNKAGDLLGGSGGAIVGFVALFSSLYFIF